MKPRVYINATPTPFCGLSALVPLPYENTGTDALYTYSGPQPESEPAENNPDVNARDDRNDEFNETIVRYNESLHSFAYQILRDMDATEDVVQDTFLALWVNREKMDFNLPLRNYLYVTARNFAFRHLRRQKRFENDLPPVPTDDQISSYMIEEEAIRILKESIHQLPERTSQVILLSLEGIPQEQIAEQMGVGVANVKRLKALGIAKLKEIMGPLFSIIGWML